MERFVILKRRYLLTRDRISARLMQSLPYHAGVDFLGFVCFPYHCILRTKTKQRMMRRISQKNKMSYAGLIAHGRTHGLIRALQAYL